MRLLADKIYTPFTGVGPLGFENQAINTDSVLFKFVKIISTVIGVFTIAAGLWFIFQLLSGALQWLGSGGDKQSLQNAQKRIVNSLVGLLIVVISYALISIIGRVFGFDILNLADQIRKLSP